MKTAALVVLAVRLSRSARSTDLARVRAVEDGLKSSSTGPAVADLLGALPERWQSHGEVIDVLIIAVGGSLSFWDTLRWSSTRSADDGRG